PSKVAAVEIDSRQVTPGWFLAGIAFIVPEPGILRSQSLHAVGNERVAGPLHHTDVEAHVHGIYVERTRFRIERSATVIASAVVAGKQNGWFQANGSIERSNCSAIELLGAERARFRRDIGEFVPQHALSGIWWWFEWNGLARRGFFALEFAGWHSSLFDLKQ